MSIVAEIVGSVLGRQVAMAIFRQTENGMAVGVFRSSDTPLLGTQGNELRSTVRSYVILSLRPEPAHSKDKVTLAPAQWQRTPIDTPPGPSSTTEQLLADVAIDAREVAWCSSWCRLVSLTRCRRQAPTGRHTNPMLLGGSDDEAADTNRCSSKIASPREGSSLESRCLN